MPYIGNQPFGKTVRTITSETLTTVKTVFSPTGGYTVGYVDVYLNGVRLTEGDDFTATNGTTVTLQFNPLISDTVDIVSYGTVEMANAVRREGDTLTGTLNTQALVPTANVTYDIGTSTMRYRDLYLSGNTIYVGDAVLNANGTSFSVANSTGGVYTSALGNTTITGTLTSNAHTMTGNLSVTGNTTLTGALTVTGNSTTISNTIIIDSNINNSNTITISSSNNSFNIVTGGSQNAYTNLILKTDSGTAQIWRGGSSYGSYAGNSGLSIYCSNTTGGHIGIFSGGETTASVMALANGCVRLPRQPIFNVTPNNSNYIQTSPIPFNSDSGYGVFNANFNTSTYRFTAPVSANYFFNLHIYTRLDPGTDQFLYPRYRVNGVQLLYSYIGRFGSQSTREDRTIQISTIYALAAGDYIDVVFNSSANGYYYGGFVETRWSGWLLG